MDKAIYSLLFCLLSSSTLALKTDFTCTRQPKLDVQFVQDTVIAIDSPDFCKFTKSDTLKVTLRSIGGEIFHAFILQAETPDHLPIGSWVKPTQHKVETCSGAMDTITNQGYDPLKKIEVEWKAPPFFWHSQIEFVASVVTNGTTWYSSRSQICYYTNETVSYTEIHDPKTEDDTETKTQEEEEDYEREEVRDGPDSSETVGNDETEREEEEGINRDDAGSDRPDDPEPDDEEYDEEVDDEVDDDEYDDEDDDDAKDGDHDQALEDDLAAKEAMKEQEDADEEDRKSEREAYQKKKMEEEQEHRDEIEKEREDFERAQAAEEEERQQRIRIEIIDKENFDRMKAEEEREAEEEANRPLERQSDEVSLNQAKPAFQNEDKKHGKNGSDVVKVGGLCLALAILRLLL